MAINIDSPKLSHFYRGSTVLVLLVLHRINAISLIRTNSLIGTFKKNKNTSVRISEGVLTM